MNFSELITSSIKYLSPFDRKHYPDNFQSFEEDAAPFFDDLAGKDPVLVVQQGIDELESRRMALPRSARKETSDAEKRVLALFLAPAARKRKDDAAVQAFLEELHRQWNARYPRNIFHPGDYDTIANGFNSTILGFPVRR